MANGDARRQRAAQAAGARKQAAGEAGAEVAVSEPADPARKLLTPMASELEAALPAQIGVETFTRVLLTLLHDPKLGPKLLNCKRPTLYKAMLDAAHYGLLPGTDEAAIIPYGDEAVFVPQYQGLVKLFYNTGEVDGVEAHLIYREDEWGLEYGDRGGFYHRPRLFDGEGNPLPRGDETNPAVLAYCYVRFKSGGRSGVEFLTRQQAIAIRDEYSRSYQMAERSFNGRPPRRDSRWHLDFDKMWLKSCVRQAAKWIPKSAALLELLMADAKADSPEARPAPFQPGGPAAAWPGDVTHGNGTVVQGEVDHGEPPEPRDRETAMRHLHAGFTDAGWGGNSDQAKTVRHAVAAALLTPPGANFPAAVTTLAELDDDQADRAARALARLLDGYREQGQDAHAELARLAEAVKQAAAEAGDQS
jgi:recombination protein RecT